jgi:hypothetical protein
MKVTLTEMGGWANIKRSCTIDTASLPRAVAIKLEDDCRLALAAPPPPLDRRVRDARTLTLVIDADGARRCASFHEPGAPAELRPILEVMRPLCRARSAEEN